MTDAKWLTEIEERVKAVDGAPWRYDRTCQWVWGRSRGGCNKELSDYCVADIRGWGHLQYMGDKRGDAKAAALQDANGLFIACAPSDVARLISEYRKVREALAAAKDAILSDSPSGPQKTVGSDDVVYHLSGQKVFRALNFIRTALADTTDAEDQISGRFRSILGPPEEVKP